MKLEDEERRVDKRVSLYELTTFGVLPLENSVLQLA